MKPAAPVTSMGVADTMGNQLAYFCDMAPVAVPHSSTVEAAHPSKRSSKFETTDLTKKRQGADADDNQAALQSEWGSFGRVTVPQAAASTRSSFDGAHRAIPVAPSG